MIYTCYENMLMHQIYFNILNSDIVKRFPFPKGIQFLSALLWSPRSQDLEACITQHGRNLCFLSCAPRALSELGGGVTLPKSCNGDGLYTVCIGSLADEFQFFLFLNFP